MHPHRHFLNYFRSPHPCYWRTNTFIHYHKIEISSDQTQSASQNAPDDLWYQTSDQGPIVPSWGSPWWASQRCGCSCTDRAWPRPSHPKPPPPPSSPWAASGGPPTSTRILSSPSLSPHYRNIESVQNQISADQISDRSLGTYPDEENQNERCVLLTEDKSMKLARSLERHARVRAVCRCLYDRWMLPQIGRQKPSDSRERLWRRWF